MKYLTLNLVVCLIILSVGCSFTLPERETSAVNNAPLPPPSEPTATQSNISNSVNNSLPTHSVFRDGTHMVGTDIQPGTYRLRIRSPACYWARLKGFSGEMGDLVANENESGPTLVTVKSNDKGFESKGCGTWTSDLSPITPTPDSPFEDGVYQIGVDIAPGTWKTDTPDDCYWARLKGFSGGMGDLITNATSTAIVQIQKSDKGFRSSGCGIWNKIR